MIKLLIIADDFTGALDTGVQMAGCGAATKVTTDTGCDFGAYEGTQVLVIDAETRHLPAQEAAQTVRDITARAVRCGIGHLYKKTDSALRGNIGAELAAMLEASGEMTLPFMPALPLSGRTTQDGVHYIDGIPVDQSVFGADPFEPVRHARVSEIVAEQSGIDVSGRRPGETAAGAGGILVYDASSQEDLACTGERLRQEGLLKISAGSAGFGSVLPDLLGLRCGEAEMPELAEGLLVICGSVNPITLRQTAAADRAGFAHWRLSPRQKLEPGYWESGEGKEVLASLNRMLGENRWLIIDSNDEGGNGPTERYAKERGLDIESVRVGISRGLGQILGALFANDALGTILITGGDTLLQCMMRLDVSELEPVRELYPGVVLSRFRYGGVSRLVLSKSGGFGQETLLADLKDRLQR